MKVFILAFDDLEDSLSPALQVQEFLEKTTARGDRCALVTLGEWALQMKKLQQLRLRLEYTILCPLRDPDTHVPLEFAVDAKRPLFSGLVKKAEGALVVIVGDRLDRDIAVGKRLSLTQEANVTTVRMRLPNGKYSHLEPQSLDEVPDFTVSSFFELMHLPLFTQS